MAADKLHTMYRSGRPQNYFHQLVFPRTGRALKLVPVKCDVSIMRSSSAYGAVSFQSKNWLCKKLGEWDSPDNYFTFSHHQQDRIDFSIVNPSLSTGKDFLIHSCSTVYYRLKED